MPVKDDGVPSLVNAVKEHRKFKQLACYSIECVAKVLCPPNSNWRENVQVAIKCDAPAIVTSVLKLHPGNEDVLMRCSACLAYLSVDTSTAELIADEGGVAACLESMEANLTGLSSESICQGMKMIEAVMGNQKAFNKVVDQKLVDRILNIMTARGCGTKGVVDAQIMLACSKVLERVGKTDAGAEMIRKGGKGGSGIDVLLRGLENMASMDYHGAEDNDIVMRVTRTLGRIAQSSPSSIKDIKDRGGVDTFLKVLESFPQDEKIARLGGKFLTLIAGDSIEELIAMLKDKNLSPAALERTLALLASLAIDGNGGDDIVRNGGVSAIIGQLESNVSAKALEATARAILRLAGNAKNLKVLIDGGAVRQLVASLKNKVATSDSKALAIEALCKVAGNSQFAEAVANRETVEAIVKAFLTDAVSPNLAAATLKFLAVLSASSNFDLDFVAKMPGAIKGVVDSMRANMGSVEIQENGTIVLNAFAVSATMAEANVKEIVKNGAVSIAIQNINDRGDNVTLLKESMNLLTNVILVKEGEVAVRQGGGIDAVVSSVMLHPDNDSIRKAAMALVELLSSDELVLQMVDGLKKFVSGKMSQSEYSKVPVMAMCLGTLAMIPENVERIMRFGGVPPMIQLMAMVAAMPTCVSQDEILAALACSLREVIGNVPVVETICDPAALLAASVAIPENHVKMANSVQQSLSLTKRLMGMCETLDVTSTEVVATTVSALRSHLENEQIAALALDILLDVTKRFGPALAIKQSATRAAVQFINTNAAAGNSGVPIKALTTAMLLVEAVSKNDEGKAALAKQGAVAAIFLAMEKNSADAAFIAVCRRAIKRLVTADDVLVTLQEISSFTETDIMNRSADIIGCVQKLGLMLLCGDFTEVIQANDGIGILVGIMQGASSMPDGPDKNALIAACVTAFGRAAGNADVSGALPIVSVIVASLRESPSVETLNAVSALARDANILKELVKQGAVEALLPIIQNNDVDPEMMQAASKALASLAQDPEGGRRIVQGGGLKFICSNITEQESLNVVPSIGLLNKLVDHCDIRTVISGGVLEAVSDLLFRMQGLNSAEADPLGLAAVINLVTKLSSTPEGAAAILAMGIPGSIVAVLGKSEDYIKSSDCILGLAVMIKTLNENDASAAEQLQVIGAADILMRGMGANSNDISVVSACVKAIGLMKGGSGGLSQIVAQVVAAIDRMEASGGTKDSIIEFCQVLQVTSNLMLEDGAVDQDLGTQIMDSLQRAMGILRNLDESQEQQDAMAAVLACLSRLSAIANLILDMNSAVGMCSGVFSSSFVVIESACACLGNIACVAGGIQSIAANGMIGIIQNAASGKGQAGKIGASGAALQAARALDVISEQALSQAVSLVGTPGGARAIASILKDIEDPTSLSTTLAQICQKQGGVEALLDAMVALGPPDFGGAVSTVEAIIRAIINERNLNGIQVNITSQEQLAALACAYKISNDAVILMETAADSLDGVRWLANTDGCFDALIAGLSSGNITVAQMSVSIFSKCIAINDPDVLARLKEAGVANSILMSLKDPANLRDEIFAQNALYSLRTLADLVGIAEMNIGKEGISLIQNALYAHHAHQYIQDTSGALLAHMIQAFAGGTESLLEDRLRNLVNVHNNASMWCHVVAEDGTAYYYNSVTGESSWEESAEHFQLRSELDAILQLVHSLDGKLKDVDIQCAMSLIGIIGTHSRDAAIMGKILDALGSFCVSSDAAACLASSQDISKIIGAMQFHLADATMMGQAIDIIDTMAGFDHLKESLSTLEYISTINTAVWSHITNKKLVTKGTRILHQLSADNETVIGFEMEVNVPNTMKYALINHPVDVGAVETIFVCLGNLLGGESDNRRVVCETCCDEIIDSLGNFCKDDHVLEIMLKTVGNISLDDDAIIWMVEKQATAKIVKAMFEHPDDVELIKLAIMVISNFGAINDEAKDAYATKFIVEEGGTLAVKDMLAKHNKDVGIVTAAMEALFNLGNDVLAAIELAKMGVMELTIEAIQTFDYEPELLSWAIKFLSVFTYAEETLDKFSKINGAEVVLKVMGGRIDDEQFLCDAVLTLSNALVSIENRAAVYEAKGVGVLLQTMDLFNHNANLIKFVIAGLNRLCTNDDISAAVAEQGMHVFMKAVQANLEDTHILTLIFELFGQLAFVKENIKLIVQHGGIKIFLQMMEVFGEDEELMCQTLHALDNIVSADEEYAAIMIEKKGAERIQSVLAAHKGNSKVESAGNSTLLSMTAMSKVKEQEGSKISRGALFARLGGVVDMSGDKFKKVGIHEKAPDGDPLLEYRSLMKAGRIIKTYENGSPSEKHIFIALDWTSLWVKHTNSTSKEAKRLFSNRIRAVTKGTGASHHKQGKIMGKTSTSAKENCSLFIDSAFENSKLGLEFKTEQDRDLFFNALSKWCEVSKKWPQLLLSESGR